MKYTQIPNNTFAELQLNAGIIVDNFDPDTGEYGEILAATTGGIQFGSNPEFLDMGEDIDNCPNGMKELKQHSTDDPTLSGTFLTVSTELAKMLIGAADIDEADEKHVVPRLDLFESDFQDLWWVGDYSDENTGETAGFAAIHMMNALNQAGFQLQTAKNEKGQFAFEFHAHYEMQHQDRVPFDVYIHKGTGGVSPSILLNKHSVTIPANGTYQLTATVVPSGTSVTWTSSATAKASVNSSGLVTAASAGTTIITAAITVDGVTYNDTCTVIVESAS